MCISLGLIVAFDRLDCFFPEFKFLGVAMFPEPLYLRLVDFLWWYLGAVANDAAEW